jgi:hypothetical protein
VSGRAPNRCSFSFFTLPQAVYILYIFPFRSRTYLYSLSNAYASSASWLAPKNRKVAMAVVCPMVTSSVVRPTYRNKRESNKKKRLID